MDTRTILGVVVISGVAVAAGACGSSSSSSDSGVSCAADGVCQPACANDPDCAGDASGGAGGDDDASGGDESAGTAGSDSGGTSGSDAGGTGGRETGGSSGAESGGSSGEETGGSGGSETGGTAGAVSGGTSGSESAGSSGSHAGGSSGSDTGETAGGGGGGGDEPGGSGGSGPSVTTAPECQDLADADLPMDDDAEGEFDALPLVACVAGTECDSVEQLTLPEGLPMGQYLLVAFSDETALEGCNHEIWFNRNNNDSRVLWEGEWPASVPAPLSGGLGLSHYELTYYKCTEDELQIRYGQSCYCDPDEPTSLDSVFLVYFYRPLNEAQCAVDGLPGDSCLWDHNCSEDMDLVCIDQVCTSE